MKLDIFTPKFYNLLRYIPVLFLVFLVPNTLLAQHTDEDLEALKPLVGKWVEKTRTKKKKQIAFKDSLQLEIRDDGFMMMRYLVGPTFNDDVRVENKKLIFKKKELDIVEVGKSNLILEDDQGRHHFYKVDEFDDAPVVYMQPTVLNDDKKVVSSQEMTGKWTCYKKTDSKFEPSTFYIKTLDIKNKVADNEYIASITMHNTDSIFSQDVRVLFDDKTVKIKLLTDELILKTSMLLDNEWVLEQGSIVYYLKQLTKK